MKRTRQNIKPSIPASEVTLDTIREGIIIALHPREAFWATGSKNVELNSFVGAIATKVNRNKISDKDANDILLGIKTGRIMVVDKEYKGNAVNTDLYTSEFAKRARRILDYPDREFEDVVARTINLKLFETAIQIEKEEGNRLDRIKLLKDRITDLRG